MSKFVWDVKKKNKINISMCSRFEIYNDEKKPGEWLVYIPGMGILIHKCDSKEKAQEFIDDLTRDELQENIERVINLIERKIYGQI